MKNFIISAFASLLCILVAWSSSAICQVGSLDRETQLDALVESYIEAQQIPGIAIAVVEQSRMVMAKAYGVDNLESKRPLTTQSIFHMASVSKPFAATSIMQLVEQGKMNLDDPLVKYLPYFKLDDSLYQQITIKQMLTHTSGIPDVQDYEWDKPQFDEGAAERYVKSLAHEKMIAGPGEKWRYSNMAFDILADVVAKVSGVNFEDYVKMNILDPLNMKESDFLRERIKPELRISGHLFDLQPKVSSVYPYNRRHAPSSCLNSNVEEMCNWAIANMDHGIFNGRRILQASSYDLLFEPQAQVDENRSIGLSWFIENRHGNKMISHGGGDTGFRSYIILIPEKSLAIVAASNYEGTQINRLAYGLIDILLGVTPEKPQKSLILTLGKTIVNTGVDSAIQQYRDLKKSSIENFDFSEGQLNTLGYLLIRSQRLLDAIAVFKINVEMFPDSFNPFDSLGEAYMLNGDIESAVNSYQQSLKLNPHNSNAIHKLEQLTR